MKSIFFKPAAKTIIDILLIVGLVLAIISGNSAESSWWSFHCIVSMVWYALMVVHIWQHWKITKAMLKWKVLKRNKITFITIVFFILLTVSIVLFMVDAGDRFVRIHHTIASPLRIVIIIHLIQKSKMFISLCKQAVRACIQ